MTIKNTLPDFFWLTNYLETLISCTLWLPCTSATSARLYKKRLMEHARKTGFPEDVNLGFSCHDFSMRGMAGLDAAIISGMAHMTSFCGSETIPLLKQQSIITMQMLLKNLQLQLSRLRNIQ